LIRKEGGKGERKEEKEGGKGRRKRKKRMKINDIRLKILEVKNSHCYFSLKGWGKK